MFKDSPAFSGFSVDDINKAKQFYGQTLGLDIKGLGTMGFEIRFSTGGTVFVYPKPNHEPASFTILNFPVKNIDDAVSKLKAQGILLEKYEGLNQDKDGIARSTSAEDGPTIAWFKDPAGNVLSVLQQ